MSHQYKVVGTHLEKIEGINMSIYEGIVFMGVVHEKGFDNLEEISLQFPKRSKEDIIQWKQWLV